MISVQATFSRPLFFLEDVYVTGILADPCETKGHLTRIPDEEGRFQLAGPEEEEDDEVGPALKAVLDLSWNRFHSDIFVCVHSWNPTAP